ncbi:CYTH domain-containing protein [Alteromonas pelagimontana]|uniref:CYTH domain-containing protein n=1 Tax=Alteromonas pelagimontana TaxID=1858656 RepID=A0A6M4MB73_9ALTE|nr:CYTH domain-containing protein [Alteromonas pelagimontana]QJR80403.1 CYTH domain-containing protein [Alteromonas pelagimontana]
MAEIEIKFVTRHNALALFLDTVVPVLSDMGMDVSKAHEKQLQNDYYDTSNHDFQHQKMGFRVRGNNGRFEQTLKTHGRVSGGLHERAEYNIPLKDAQPDLRLFDKDVWPPEWDADVINTKLARQFSTHFTRTAFEVGCHGSVIELVFDEGEVKTGKARAPIQEIELELLEGQVSELFLLATVLNEKLELRLSDVSKAAQGYQLLHGVNPQVKPLPAFLQLHEEETTENAFAKSAQCALAHWQHHEHLYLETGSVKLLSEVADSLRLLLQSVSLYLPVLQCPEMLELHKQVMKFMQVWLWQEDLQSLRYLLSKKSLFNKCLSKYPSLLSYLQGRKAGLIHAHAPDALFYDKASTQIKIMVSEILYSRPWREHAKGYDMPVTEHAKGWLSQDWQAVQQSLPRAQAMGPANYIAIENMLRQTMWNGFLLADLFPAERDQFRAPWLDILTGIEELKALLVLKQTLRESELESQEELMQWVEDKTNNLLNVMERTRQVGMQSDVYW